MASISEKLGHKDKSTTLRHYTHSNSEKIKEASQVFRNAVKAVEKGKRTLIGDKKSGNRRSFYTHFSDFRGTRKE